MRKLCVVEHQPITHFLVEQRQIRKEQVFVVIDKAVLYGAIEPFTVGIHFGSFGVCPPMNDLVIRQAFCKVPFEFTAVICKSFCMGVVWKDVGNGFMQFSRVQAADVGGAYATFTWCFF